MKVDEVSKNIIICDYLIERCKESSKRMQELWEEIKASNVIIEEMTDRIKI